jgi:hypothetical protein
MTARLVVAASVIALLAAPAPPVPRKGLPPVPGKSLPVASGPSSLSLYIGGAIFPPNYFVTLGGDTLTYRVRSIDSETNKPVESSRTIKPSPEQWREFWRSMDDVGLWHWRPVYEDSRVADGTHWSVEAVHGGKSIRSRGRILFPGVETLEAARKLPEGTGPLFEKYLAAVEKLLGGLPFR